MGEKPNQGSNDPEARTAPMISCVPRAAETRGGEDHQREHDHQREAGLLGQGGLRLGARGCVGGNIYLSVALFSRKYPKANKDKTIEHLLPLRMKARVSTMWRGVGRW